jgi:3-methyl-2-oxobutanoate hydroxymethyltransferase
MATRRRRTPRPARRPPAAGAPAPARAGAGAAGAATAAAPPRAKVTAATLVEMKRGGRPIVMVTAYDYPFARLVDAAGVDAILVGDSLGMVVLGYESTLPVTLADVLHHVRAVARARPRALVIADLPFMSFQVSPRQAVRNAGRLVQEGGAEAVKLEGGERMLPMVEAIARADIPVLGHLGLTPQSVHHFGGYRVQGRSAEARVRLRREARQLQDAGCFGIVLEAIPTGLAADIRAAVAIPTIGIGAGLDCDGQVLVLHDFIGLPGGPVPRFVQRFGDVGGAVRAAVDAYAAAVRQRRFPGAEHTYGS